MDYNEKAKHHAAQLQEKLNAQCLDTAQSNVCGVGAIGGPATIGIRERVWHKINSASEQASRLERLMELDKLLSEHPEVARILDLTEYLRDY